MPTGWIIKHQKSIDGLELVNDLQLPTTVAANEVLVKLRTASLNYRDLVILDGGTGPTAQEDTIAASDGAGEVLEIGSNVQDFVVGDKVCILFPSDLEPTTMPSFKDTHGGRGQGSHGTLREFGVFPERSLAKMPTSLTFEEGATLPCAWLTAWNALFGLEERRDLVGKTVLVQGSGGVSTAALQLAVAAGATVVATTGKKENEGRLKEIGALCVLNYRETPGWGSWAGELANGGEGVDIAVEVGGASTLRQSLKATRMDCLIAVTGILGHGSENENSPAMMDAALSHCTARGVLLGSKVQFDEMVQLIEKNGIRPVYDERVFDLSQAKEAYGMLKRQEHFGKVIIVISK